MKKNIHPIQLSILILCLVILFRHAIEFFLSKFLVTPLLKDIVFLNSPQTQLAFFVVITMFLIQGLLKIRNGFVFSYHWIMWSVILAITYIYYRNSGKPWEFHDLLFIGNTNIKAADFVFLIPFYFLSSWIVLKIKAVIAAKNINSGIGFLHDAPVVFAENYDIHERLRFIYEIKDKIINSLPGESSFAIGIIGKWGYGKTSFMKTIEDLLSNERDIIQFTFNPWLIPNPAGITETFFNEFRQNLSQYTDTIQADIKEYVRLIAKESKQSVPLTIAQYIFPSFSWGQSTIQVLKERISNALRTLNRKVIIYIDDVDRLDQHETVEVLRLIRNSAGFSNVFFLVAFDKSQVVNSLKSSFELGNDRFLEKIFQIEFFLPPIKQGPLLSELIECLNKRISEDDKKVLNEMFNVDSSFGIRNYSWIQNYLDHHRDISRFMNHFDLHYRFVKGEIYLPDFIVTMLIRLRYPEVYHFLYSNQGRLLTIRKTRRRSKNGGELVLKHEETEPGIKKSLESTTFYKLINELPELSVRKNDLRPIKLINELFDEKEDDLYSSLMQSNELPKKHLSIVFPDFFNRYFDFSFNGHLSDVEFEDIFDKSNLDDFIAKVKFWCQNEKTGYELINALERKTFYGDINQFDRVIKALLLIANTKIPNNSNRNYIVNRDFFLERFNTDRSNTKDILLFVFGSMENLQSHMKELLFDNCSPKIWLYEVVRHLLKNNDILFPVSRLELKEYIKKAFEIYISENPAIDGLFLRYSLDRKEQTEESEISKFTNEIRLFLNSRIIQTLTIIIGPCPQHKDQGNYRLYDDWIIEFYGSLEAYISDIENYSKDFSIELREFVSAVQSEPEHNKCVNFVFKKLPIPPIDAGNPSEKSK